MSSSQPTHENATNNAADDPYNGKVLLAAVISLSIVIFFVLLLHIYARWLLKRRPPIVRPLVHHRQITTLFPTHNQHNYNETTLPSNTNTSTVSNCGLAAEVVASLPVFVYKANEYKDDEVVECVICLSLMEDNEKGRILPSCMHAFHVECIDMWLMSHSNCPICRAEVMMIKVDELQATKVDGEAMQGVVRVEVGGEVVQDEEGLMVGSVSSSESSSDSSDEVVLEIINARVSTVACQVVKEEVSSSSSSTTSTSSCGCSLKRMLSRSRSENRVFPGQ